MTYQVGEEVILNRLMGEDVNPPVRVQITDQANVLEKGRLFQYEIAMNAKSIQTGREVKNLKCWVKAEWLAPAQIVINEAPETPWD